VQCSAVQCSAPLPPRAGPCSQHCVIKPDVLVPPAPRHLPHHPSGPGVGDPAGLGRLGQQAAEGGEHCTALHCTALHCTAHCTALQCTALHCTALHCTALHCTVLHCTALHTTMQRNSATEVISSLSDCFFGSCSRSCDLGKVWFQSAGKLIYLSNRTTKKYFPFPVEKMS
jgi:hypothetical protein